LRPVNCNKWEPDETTILLEEKIMTHKFNDYTESLFTSPFSRESNQGASSLSRARRMHQHSRKITVRSQCLILRFFEETIVLDPNLQKKVIDRQAEIIHRSTNSK